MCQAPLEARSQQATSLKAKSVPKAVLVNKVYWNIATLIHLHIVYGCFLAELRCWDRNHLAHKAPHAYLSGHLQEKLADSILGKENTMIKKKNEVPRCLQMHSLDDHTG